MTGDLKEIRVGELVQIVCVERHQARLRVEQGDVEASIYFADGQIVHAQTPTLRGPRALYEILKWTEGRFRLEKGVVSPERTVEGSWTAHLLEGIYGEEKPSGTPLVPVEPPGSAEPEAAPRSAAPSGPAERLRAVAGVEQVILATPEGMAPPGVEGQREADVGVTAFVGNAARELGACLALGEFESVSFAVDGAHWLVLSTGDGFVGLRLAAGAERQQVAEKARAALR